VPNRAVCNAMKAAHKACRILTQVLWLLKYGRISTVPKDELKDALVAHLKELDYIFHPEAIYVKRDDYLDDSRQQSALVHRQLPTITILCMQDLLNILTQNGSTGAVYISKPDVTPENLLSLVAAKDITLIIAYNLKLKDSLLKFFLTYFHKPIIHNKAVRYWISNAFNISILLEDKDASTHDLTDLKYRLMSQPHTLSEEDASAVTDLVSLSM
jgi:hypothetical protein